MLSCHSQVEGTRELARPPHPRPGAGVAGGDADAGDAIREVRGVESPRRWQPSPRATWRALAGTASTGKARFVDKLPGNWSLLGFALLLFPRASIIDARRHPLGSGFSCYKQLFARGQQFTYDLREVGLFSRDYIGADAALR